jgi:UDP-glucose:(heptosyl)LPS alpha-1,3-glucosyltransferase
MSLRVLYLVRAFAPVGGMERYVFDTAREMVERGHQVSVLARTTDQALADRTGVQVFLTDPTASRRGWRDRYLFRDEVTKFLSDPERRDAFDIIHSHENTVEQDVSTEHGPCTAYGLRRAPWKQLDYSARKNLALEKQKFTGPHLAALISCARRVQDIALREYPSLEEKITGVITPAYSYLKPPVRAQGRAGRTLGFMGRDWKRKGLPKALEIFRRLRHEDPAWTFLVAGCPEGDPPQEFRNRAPEGTTFIGRADPREFFGRIDVLVHPARDEPFGMVVSEALTCGVPAVISDQCGCADHLTGDGLRVLPVGAAKDAWAEACRELAGHSFPPIAARTWADVAADHERLYDRILKMREDAWAGKPLRQVDIRVPHPIMLRHGRTVAAQRLDDRAQRGA